ncbi:MAG: C4-dicarboxylate ABC transporter substrate-binding protein, partial [Treponema sp.]|nr:C4-dicarboxylate ABC transporter substrate-binding protein [Treponema sp.]
MQFTKRFSLAVLAALIAAGSVFAGGGQAQPGSGSAAQQKVTIKVGDNWGASHPMAAALDTVFKPQIEQASGGALTVDIYHDGTLGNEGDLWNGVRNGTIEV